MTDYKRIDKLTIKRSRWARGEGEINSLLNSQTGRMCCLGFFCLEVGCIAEDITDEASPGELAEIIPLLTLYDTFGESEQYVVDSTFTNKAIQINDDKTLLESTREANLINLFKEHGIELTIVD